MVPRLVPEISSLDAFCDGAAAGGGAAAGIGDSRSLISSNDKELQQMSLKKATLWKVTAFMPCIGSFTMFK